MAFVPTRGEAVLLVKGQGIEAWSWQQDHFTRLADDFLEGREVAWPCGWFDPHAGEFLVGAAVAEGLAVRSLTHPGPVQLLPFGSLAEGWTGPVVAFDAARGSLFALCRSGQKSELRVWRDQQVSTLGPTPLLTSLAFDPVLGSLVGESFRDTYLLEGDSWRRLSSAGGWCATQPTWHQGLRALVRFEIEPGRLERMQLTSLTRSEWQVVEPVRRLSAVRPQASLVVLGEERLLAHGGARGTAELLPTSIESFLSAPGGDLEPSLQPSRLRLGRTSSLLSAVKAPLTVVDHSALDVAMLRETGWHRASLSSSPAHFGGPHDDRRTAFALASGGFVYELDDDGGLWRAPPGGLLEQIAPAAQGPGPRCTGHHALAHDSVRKRLVLFGGVERNDTWLFDETAGTWREVLSTPRPPHGPGALCATPGGVYLFVQRELWWLDDAQWRCVGHDPDWEACVLFCDPMRNTLWSAANGKVVMWRRGKFHEVVALPREVTSHPYPFARDHLVGLDPIGDRLVTWDETATRVLSLALLGGAATGQLPVRSRTPPTQRRVRPPRGVLRTAARFQSVVGSISVTRVPGVRIPPGYRLLAVAPRHPRLLPLPGGVTGLAVLVPEDASEAYEHTRVVQLTGEAPVGAWLRIDHALRPCVLLEHQEIDPARQEELDTLQGHQFDHAFSTKVGGFGRFVQDDPAPRCKACQGPMRFALQLGCEVFMVGDMGETYAFFCPRGCGARAVLQTH